MKRFLKYLKPYTVRCILAPLFKMLEATFELLVPLVIAQMVDAGIAEKNGNIVVRSAIFLFVLAVVGMVAAITAQYFSARVAMDFGREVRGALFRHIEKLSFSAQDEIGTSTLITRMTNDVNQMQTGVNMILRLLLRSPFIVFGATFMAFRVNSKVGLYFVYILAALFIVVTAIILVSIPLVRRIQTRLDSVTLHTRENITGVRVVRAFNNQESEKEDFHKASALLMKTQLFLGRISAFLNPVTLVIINTGIAVVVYNGGILVDTGVLEKGEVIALYNYMSYILVELIKFVNFIITVSKMYAGARRVSAVMDIEDDDMQEAVDEEITENEILSADDSVGSIEFKNVSMTYRGSKETAVSDISFRADKGELIGIIGGTGSGKSTLVSLIAGYYQKDSGEITFDGKAIEDIPQEKLRSMVAFTMQRAVLFSGSIAENLRMAREDATDEDIDEALSKAQAKEFVDKKEGGKDFLLSRGGRNLSGGQRQRISIARTLVQNLPVMIFDDSYSALDYATEKKLRLEIDKLKNEKIIFVVSQRIGSCMHADKIIVMERGSVVGVGTHDELLKSCDVYKEICASQMQEGEVAS